MKKQYDLFNEIEQIAETPPEAIESVPVKSHDRKRGKRARLSEELPRIETVIDIEEAEKRCGCGSALVRIGEDISERLEVIPARFFVCRTVRPFVIGRKNYLFHGSPTGADASALLYTIIETAKVNGHEPFYYLFYLFSKLPFVKDNTDYLALLPFNVSRKDVHSFAIENWLTLDS